MSACTHTNIDSVLLFLDKEHNSTFYLCGVALKCIVGSCFCSVTQQFVFSIFGSISYANTCVRALLNTASTLKDYKYSYRSD